MGAERRGNHLNIQAPLGAYEYLEQIGNYQFNDRTNGTRVWVLKEEVCQETGGSCMDLTIRERVDIGGETNRDYHAHITQRGAIVSLSTYFLGLEGRSFGEGMAPDIADMLSTLKNILAREDVEKYPR